MDNPNILHISFTTKRGFSVVPNTLIVLLLKVFTKIRFEYYVIYLFKIVVV